MKLRKKLRKVGQNKQTGTITLGIGFENIIIKSLNLKENDWIEIDIKKIEITKEQVKNGEILK